MKILSVSNLAPEVIASMLCPVCEYNTLLGTQHAWLAWVTLYNDDRPGPVKDISVVCRNACHGEYVRIAKRYNWMLYDWHLESFVGPTTPHPFLGFSGLVPRMGGLLCDYEWPQEPLKKFSYIMSGLSLMVKSKDGEIVLAKGWSV